MYIDYQKTNYSQNYGSSEKKYDLFLSIELTSSSYKILKINNKKTPLLLWIQDPRPWYEWREINTVKLYPEPCYWDSKVYEYVHDLYLLNKVHFITQGESLNNKARDLYRLNNDTPIKLIPNPVETNSKIDTYSKKIKSSSLVELSQLNVAGYFAK